MQYYDYPAVRARIGDFLSDEKSNGQTTSVFVVTGDRRLPFHHRLLPVNRLDEYLDQDLDISRSLWDKNSLLVDLDLEYVNFDFPTEVYLHPERSFQLQEPVCKSIERHLLKHGINALHLLSGRGHHFVWCIRRGTPAFARLAALGNLPESLAARYASIEICPGLRVDPELGAAFAGLSKVVEYFAHAVKSEVSLECRIPMDFAAVEPGRRERGREMIALDISAHGDPLDTRVVRAPFSRYLKPSHLPSPLNREVENRRLITIPVFEASLAESLEIMRNETAAAELATRAPTTIPESSPGTLGLITGYLKSSLAEYHKFFYAAELDPRAAWPETYGRTSYDSLPICIRRMLDSPNDLLLRPACVRQLTRVLLALGWHPRHIAGLICMKFEEDHEWDNTWDYFDRLTRAEFYVRVFSGQCIGYCDPLKDFNCVSAQEQGLSVPWGCWFNLFDYNQSLTDRKHYERLASRPFHGLFQPARNP